MGALSSAKRQNQQRWRWGDGGDRDGDKDSPSTWRHKRNKYQSELAAVEWWQAKIEREVLSKNFFSCLLDKRFSNAVAVAFQQSEDGVWAKRALFGDIFLVQKKRAFHSICLFYSELHSIFSFKMRSAGKCLPQRNNGGSFCGAQVAEEVQVFGGGVAKAATSHRG